MFARVNIVYDRRPDTLQLPRTAILDADGEQSVYVVANGKAEQRKVRTGLDERRLDRGGRRPARATRTVVVVGQAGLKSGTPVKIVGDDAPQNRRVVPAGQAKAK